MTRETTNLEKDTELFTALRYTANTTHGRLSVSHTPALI